MSEIAFKDFCNRSRLNIIDLAFRCKIGHIASAFSIVEILGVLYNGVLSFTNTRCSSFSTEWDSLDRDRFILSKGHGSLAIYSTLYLKNFIDDKAMQKFLSDGSQMTLFPTKPYPKGLDFSSGSLGHGLSVGCGIAYGLLHTFPNSRVFVLCSDGEFQEGSTWEALQFAVHHGLNNLTVIIDSNGLQAFDKIDNVISQSRYSKTWEALGWSVLDIDGHNYSELKSAMKISQSIHSPVIVKARTVKGKGVSFMENSVAWHYLTLTREEYEQAMNEIKGNE